MPTNLSGIIFNQVYTDNTGGPGAEYDSDGDGVATQEDEFVGILNNSGSSVDISGWQIWSDSAGSGAPDTPVDGLYHTFAAGTIIGAGAHLTVINEISTGGSVPYSAIEASEGGVESGAGGVSTNLLTEGDGGTKTESIVLVNPATGEYIVFNFGPDPFDESTISGFPGTISLGEVDAEAVSADPGTGFAVQYDSGTDSYILDTVFVPCFTPGTRLSVPSGTQKVEELKVGDLVTTHDGGSTVVRATIRIDLDLTDSHNSQHKPIIFKEDCFGKGCPERPLMVSPQHRVLMEDNLGNSVLVPAKALTDRPGIRIARGRRSVTYIQIICTDHSVIEAENLWTESFLPGPYSFSNSDDKSRQILTEIFPELVEGKFPNSPHRILKVSEAKRQKLKPPRQNRSDHLKRVTAA